MQPGNKLCQPTFISLSAETNPRVQGNLCNCYSPFCLAASGKDGPIKRQRHKEEATCVGGGDQWRCSHPSPALALLGPSSTPSLSASDIPPWQMHRTDPNVFLSPAQGVHFDFDPQTTTPQVSLLPSYPLRPPGMESRRTCLRVLHYEAPPDLNVLILIPLSSLHSKSKAKNPFFFFPFFPFFYSSRCC